MPVGNHAEALMADNRGLGCFGAVVAVPVLGVIAWKTLEITAAVGGAFAAGKATGLITDPGFLHQFGELTVLGSLLVGIYVAVFRPEAVERSLGSLRVFMWAGAAFELGAWATVPAGVRWKTWALVLAVVGMAGPWLVRLVARKADR